MEITTNSEDLCKQCEHYWTDFPLPLDRVISHCSVLDKKPIGQDLDDIVPYPCLQCPFDSFVKIKK